MIDDFGNKTWGYPQPIFKGCSMGMANVCVEPTIDVNEMFTSISGEVGIIPQGQICTVLRLQGCNLHCGYCDAKSSIPIHKHTNYAMIMSLLADRINENGYPLLLTGGEPMLQQDAVKELLTLIDSKIVVQIETNGTVPIGFLKHYRTSIVMDYKFHEPPAKENILNLRKSDYLKFVVSSEIEILQACSIISKMACTWTNAISATNLDLYSHIIEAIKVTDPKTLVNVQLHKTINVR